MKHTHPQSATAHAPNTEGFLRSKVDPIALMLKQKNDSQIKEDVLRELKWDPRIDETDVGVQVIDGIVRLVGMVNSYARKMATQEAAHRVAGVLDVANDLDVELPDRDERSDVDIARAVRNTLAWDDLVPHEQIRSTVTNGWVTLEGTVDSIAEKQEASRAIARITGSGRHEQ